MKKNFSGFAALMCGMLLTQMPGGSFAGGRYVPTGRSARPLAEQQAKIEAAKAKRARRAAARAPTKYLKGGIDYAAQ